MGRASGPAAASWASALFCSAPIVNQPSDFSLSHRLDRIAAGALRSIQLCRRRSISSAAKLNSAQHLTSRAGDRQKRRWRSEFSGATQPTTTTPTSTWAAGTWRSAARCCVQVRRQSYLDFSHELGAQSGRSERRCLQSRAHFQPHRASRPTKLSANRWQLARVAPKLLPPGSGQEFHENSVRDLYGCEPLCQWLSSRAPGPSSRD